MELLNTIILISVCTINTHAVCPHLSDKRKGQMSGTGGVAGRSFARAMMCSKVISVCVQTSVTHTSFVALLLLCATAAVALLGVCRRTWTTMGSRRMVSATVSSWPALEKSRAFTWEKGEQVTQTPCPCSSEEMQNTFCCSLRMPFGQ